jgi:hypothetical protein
MGILQAMGLFDEVSLYGTLIHVVAEGIKAHQTRIEAALREAGVATRSMDIIAPSLEDVFIASVREQENGTQITVEGQGKE